MTKRCATRNCIFMRPLWRRRPVRDVASGEEFGFRRRSGAIIEHERASPGSQASCRRGPRWDSLPRPNAREATMSAAWLAVAIAGPRARPTIWDPRILWATVAFVAAVVVGYLVVVWVDRWRKQPVQ